MSEPSIVAEERLGFFQIVILFLTILNLFALVADTLLALPKEVSKLIQTADTGVCIMFFIDFGIRFSRAESKREFMKWGWIDLIASIPNIDLLRWGRLIRVLRVIRLLRGIRSLQRIMTMIFQNRVESGAISIGLTAFLLLSFASVSILICERDPRANIKTAEDAVWWSVSTMTTVGYGDTFPVTTEGRVIGMTLMIAGIGLFGGLSGLVASFFLGERARHSPETKAIFARLDQLQAKIDELSRQPKADGEYATRRGEQHGQLHSGTVID